MEGGVCGGRCVEGDSVEGGVWRKINDYRCGGGGGNVLQSYHSTTLTISKLCSMDSKLICSIEQKGHKFTHSITEIQPSSPAQLQRRPRDCFPRFSRAVFTDIDQITQTLHYSNARPQFRSNWASSVACRVLIIIYLQNYIYTSSTLQHGAQRQVHPHNTDTILCSGEPTKAILSL